MTGTGSDLRHAVRAFRRRRAFTATILSTFALGIGANTAVFSLLHILILRDLPVRDPDQLVEPLSLYPGDPRVNSFGEDYYAYVRGRNTVFSDLTGVARPAGTADGGIRHARVLGNFFPLLGLDAAVGRLIGPEDVRAGAARVAVLAWSFWHREYGGDPGVVGLSILVDGAPATIAGVAPRGFSGLQAGATTDVWVPFDGEGGLALLGRLRAGVSVEEAQAEMRVLDRRRVDEIARTSGDPQWRAVRIELEDASGGFSPLRDRFGRPVIALMAIAGLLLAQACANIAGLLLVHTLERRREMALRAALGATRGRLFRQALTESVLLSTAGAIPGIVLAYAGAKALAQALASGRPLPGFGAVEIQIRPDIGILLFSAGIALATGVLCGLASAVGVSRVPATLLREGEPAGQPPSQRVSGQSLVAAEVALAVVLLGGAALLGVHLWNLRNVGLGFEPDSVLLADLAPERDRRDRLFGPYRELAGRLRALPGVISVSFASHTPIAAGAALRFANVEGFDEAPDLRRYLWLRWVGPGYFRTLGIPLRRGRDFRFADRGGPRVVIVSEAVAAYYFGEGDPIGRRLVFDGDTEHYEVVGVAGDAKYTEPDEPAPRTVYLNAFQEPQIFANQLVVRTEAPPLSLAEDVRRTVEEVVPDAPVHAVTTLADQVDASIVPERLIARLAALSGGLGAILAAIGLYGFLAYTLGRRTREFGIRIALGATPARLAVALVRAALGSVLAGMIGGAWILYWSLRWARHLIEGLPDGNAFPLSLAILVLAVTAAMAAWTPVRRALRTDPARALRHE